jgi:hypothetical protein
VGHETNLNRTSIYSNRGHRGPRLCGDWKPCFPPHKHLKTRGYAALCGTIQGVVKRVRQHFDAKYRDTPYCGAKCSV